MPLVYWGTGWFIGIALASALHLPIELLLPAFLFPIVGLFLRHFDQNSLSTYNGSGVVTLAGVISGPPDVRDIYLNLRVNADQLTLPDRSARPIEGTVLVRPSRPAEFHYGDRLRVTGELNAPPTPRTSSPSAGKYKSNRGVPFVLTGTIPVVAKPYDNTNNGRKRTPQQVD